jgi:hypothetical protein
MLQLTTADTPLDRVLHLKANTHQGGDEVELGIAEVPQCFAESERNCESTLVQTELTRQGGDICIRVVLLISSLFAQI